ncbi:hypothetical protein LY78DRAFT_118696 [Colletotrichum sublineola]|nr:hypothetical protein LY78DRAFT_118696 [Colletotrichum sublineola]
MCLHRLSLSLSLFLSPSLCLPLISPSPPASLLSSHICPSNYPRLRRQRKHQQTPTNPIKRESHVLPTKRLFPHSTATPYHTTPESAFVTQSYPNRSDPRPCRPTPPQPANPGSLQADMPTRNRPAPRSSRVRVDPIAQVRSDPRPRHPTPPQPTDPSIVQTDIPICYTPTPLLSVCL